MKTKLDVVELSSVVRTADPIVIDPPATATNNAETDGLLTIYEAASVLSLSTVQARRVLIGAGVDPAQRAKAGVILFSRMAVERLRDERAHKAAEKARREAEFAARPLRRDRPFIGQPVIPSRRPSPAAPRPKPVSVARPEPEPDPAASHDEALDPLDLGIELPRERPPADESNSSRKNGRLFVGGPSKGLYPVGPNPSQVAAKKARDDARAAALGALDPSRIKRLPSAAVSRENYLAERARFDEETARLATLKEKKFRSGMTAAERQELDRDERIMLQRATWVAHGLLTGKRNGP